ncbi:MAG TPA: hypothetical protein DEA55_09520 [Rhodospirillaceae bacterium]|nr:hypothetical protein [Rhodospirillaceae bacterium]
MFELTGFINTGKTVLGCVNKNGQDYLVAVSLLEGDMRASRVKATEKEIRAKMLSPDRVLRPDSLSETFSDCNGQTLTVQIESPTDAVGTIEPVLTKTGCRMVHFSCKDQQTYLTVCTELAMRRRDFFVVSELHALLKEDSEKTKTVIGSYHQLCDEYNAHGLQLMPNFPELSERDFGVFLADAHATIQYGLRAPKFKLAHKRSSEAIAEFEKNHEFAFYPGDYRFPYECAVFDIEGTEGGNGLPEIKFRDIVIMHSEEGSNVVYSRLFRKVKDSPFIYFGMGPGWRLSDDGKVKDLCHATPFVEIAEACPEYNGRHGPNDNALCRILSTVAAINEPQNRILTHRPGEGLLKKRKENGRTRIFDYMEVQVNRPKDVSGAEIRGNALVGHEREGGVALHMVRRHQRVLPSGNETWVREHVRGNPFNGATALANEM